MTPRTSCAVFVLLGWRRKRKTIAKKYLLIASTLVCSLLNLSTAFSNTVYDVVNLVDLGFVGFGISLTGTITTDGTTGTLSAANIIDWNLAITNFSNPATSITLTPIPPAPGNSVLGFSGPNLSASPSSLTFNFSGPSGFLEFVEVTSLADLVYVSAGNFPPGFISLELSEPFSSPDFFNRPQSGTQVIATVEATPLPATLPLFATGLGALGLLCWRRKKKAAALAA